MDPPVTRYVQRAGRALAYQVVGDDGHDVVWFMEINLHLDLMWTDPHIHYLLERGSSYARTAFFQCRGLGMSDPVDHIPTIEEQADDIVAVMDELGMASATMSGVASTCAPLSLVAARSPERVAGLVLVQPFAEALVDSGVPHGWTSTSRARFVDGWRAAFDAWGSGMSLAMWDPALDSPRNRRIMAMMERCSATPGTARAYLERSLRSDYSSMLPAIQAPTRVLLVPSGPVPENVARYVADRIPRGTFQWLPKTLRGSSLGESFTPAFDQLELAATGANRPVEADEFLATVLFTDLVGSTELLARIGDLAYRDVRAAHERQVHELVESAGGRVVNVVGDGTFSVFDGPIAAVRCADRIRAAVSGIGLMVRCGVHSGVVEHDGSDLTGMTVHIGARTCGVARAGEVLVSQAVRDLAQGSGLGFACRGVHTLRGVPGRWQLFAVGNGDPDESDKPWPCDGPPAPNLLDRMFLRVVRGTPGLARTVVRLSDRGGRWRRPESG
ncbi:adenylate/guanylate cyclase domain-containing protein [Prescottella agglutinans]|uniref:Adenylate/guanylate cyclase domain-containing protein n=1 Tax=Prescottella agglutinans TaxID=1644129 RepID=A0A3S3E9B4_9NOCA|nr:adenylate/guanylate cyclase domain-containing protein [Prescottella agglutinans]RVW08715.1 adenylate/guanylate cyclase domain-containing protein [Prescottella agglutinans]